MIKDLLEFLWKFGLVVPCSEAKSKTAFDCSPNGEILARCPIEIREAGMNDSCCCFYGSFCV